jgi:hypothetical protein
MSNFLPFNTIANSCSGVCICIGSGGSSSLLAEYSKFKNYFHITSNFSQINYPSSFLYCYQDSEFIEKAEKSLIKKSLGICILPKGKNLLKNEKLGGFYINRNIHNICTFKKNTITIPTVLTGSTSIYIANLLGFTKIILIGYDAKIGNYNYFKPHPRMGHSNYKARAKHSIGQNNFINRYKKQFNLINCSWNNFNPQIKIKDALLNEKENYKDNVKIIENLFLKNINENFKNKFNNF